MITTLKFSHWLFNKTALCKICSSLIIPCVISSEILINNVNMLYLLAVMLLFIYKTVDVRKVYVGAALKQTFILYII